ncbi:unnamed protein product [Brassica rapa subsp. narinosa]
MDTYSCKGSAPKEPFDSEPAAKEKFNYISSRVRISVEGFSHGRPTDEIKSELINHFKSFFLKMLFSVEVPTDPILESRAFVNYHGHHAKRESVAT